MINQEQIAAYREMAKNASENSMEAQQPLAVVRFQYRP